MKWSGGEGFFLGALNMKWSGGEGFGNTSRP